MSLVLTIQLPISHDLVGRLYFTGEPRAFLNIGTGTHWDNGHPSPTAPQFLTVSTSAKVMSSSQCPFRMASLFSCWISGTPACTAGLTMAMMQSLAANKSIRSTKIRPESIGECVSLL